MGVWLGNPDTTTLLNGNSTLPGPIISKVMAYAHQLYEQEGKYKAGDWFTKPAGVQTISGELFPSWYKKGQGQTNAKLTFDSVSKKKATDCTPDAAKTELDVMKSVDPVTKKDVFIAPDGYDASKDDDVHKCDDSKPTVGTISVAADKKTITVNVAQGTHGLTNLELKVGGSVVESRPITSAGSFTFTYNFVAGTSTITATVRDDALYEGTGSQSYTY
ncbi:MAG: hypothetical protein ABJA64_00695, partial [Candidatus Saccharibacteria bacterium]